MKNIFSLIFFISLATFSKSQNVLITNRIDSLGQKQGKWVYIDSTYNKITQTFYINDLENGRQLVFNSEGKLLKETELINGIKNGFCWIYTADGAMKTILLFQEGELKHSFLFSENGRLIMDYNVSMGEIDGISHFYNKKNKLNAIRTFFSSELHGKSIFFNKNGQVKETKFYYLGTEIVKNDSIIYDWLDW